jgi:hypothetical protein
MRLYFGRDEKDVIQLEPGGTSDRTVLSTVAMRPRLLCCMVGGWRVENVGIIAQRITVVSLRIGDEEQMMGDVPLSAFLSSPGIALPVIPADVRVCIKLASTMMEDRIKLVLWLEGEEIHADDRSTFVGHAFVGDVFVGDGVSCGTRSPAEQIAHLEHQLQKAHAQRDVAVDALKRIAGPDGAERVWSQEIAKEALKQIHALRRPNATTRGK